MRCLYVFALVFAVACGGRNSGSGDGGVGDDQPDAVVVEPDAPELCVGGTLCGVPLSCCDAGNECVLDQCVPTCATGVYCGADLGTCCGANQVCSGDSCVDPGAACQDAYDCDPGSFCEPTLTQCLPQPNPLTCKLQPTFSTLSVVEEHAYTAAEIISIPVVANLDATGAPEIVVNTARIDSTTDFNGGRIVILNGNDLTVKVGPIQDDRTNATNPSYASHGRATIATGDVNGDAKPDIIYAARPATTAVAPGATTGAGSSGSIIVAIDGTGKLLWFSHKAGSPTVPYAIKVLNGAATLANFDADASAEIVFGGTLLDNDGTVMWDGGVIGTTGYGAGGYLGTNGGYNGGVAVVADLDNDGKPEIVTGNKAWKVVWNATTPPTATVTNFWPNAATGLLDGYPAIADLDLDGKPDVALVSSAKLTLLDGQTGALLCAKPTACGADANAADRVQPIGIHIPAGTVTPNPNNNIGGPPTVADFDGDGRPEIAVAGGYSYSVYDLHRMGEDTTTHVGTVPAVGQAYVRWTAATQDLSSNATGSSVFDFQGDGAAEVIYEDECYVRVYSGVNGAEQLKLPNTTGTIHEYPLVVDADGDGNSEILVVANTNNSCSGVTSRKGLFMYGDANDKWVPTRKVWTQHGYHVTNADSAGNVPMTESNNWTTPGLNDYRKNAQGEGVFNAPNLTVELAIGLDKCSTGMLSLRARVTNVGALGVFPGVVVEFRQGSATGMVLGTGTVTTPLLPGGSALVTLDVASTASMDFWAGVDGAPATGAITECDELDNQDTAIGAMCPVIF